MPLPKGIVRVYKADKSGAQQFIGEDAIDHTPRDEKVRIKMGESFDVVGDRKQMAWNVVRSCVSESEWEIDAAQPQGHGRARRGLRARRWRLGNPVGRATSTKRKTRSTFTFDGERSPRAARPKITYRVE